MTEYDIETLIKAKKQYELAAELMDVAICEHERTKDIDAESDEVSYATIEVVGLSVNRT